MAMNISDIETHLKEAFPKAKIEVKDLKGNQEYIAVDVRDPEFSGLTRIQQHKKVYEALKGHAGTSIHAVTIKTGVPP